MKYATLIFFLLVSCGVQASDVAPPFPANPNAWLNQKPLQWSQLKGKVVLLNVWTFGCWNSYRSLPWLATLQKKFPDLQIIGIHSPEFGYEKDRTRMRALMLQYNVNYPQLLDDDHAYWNRLSNTYWPSFYVVDQAGKIRGRFAGETHAGDSQAIEIETLIRKLM